MPAPAIQDHHSGLVSPVGCDGVWPQAERHRQQPYDQLVIETTGMANPLPIMQIFGSAPEIFDHLRLVSPHTWSVIHSCTLT